MKRVHGLISIVLALAFLLTSCGRQNHGVEGVEDVLSEPTAEPAAPFWEVFDDLPSYIRYNESEAFPYPRSYSMGPEFVSDLWRVLDPRAWKRCDTISDNWSDHLIFMDVYDTQMDAVVMIDLDDRAALYQGDDSYAFDMPSGTYEAFLSAMEEIKTVIRNETLSRLEDMLPNAVGMICHPYSLKTERPYPGEVVIYDERTIAIDDKPELETIGDALSPLSWTATDMDGVDWGGGSLKVEVCSTGDLYIIELFAGDVVWVDAHESSRTGDFFLAPEGTYEEVLALLER